MNAFVALKMLKKEYTFRADSSKQQLKKAGNEYIEEEKKMKIGIKI